MAQLLPTTMMEAEAFLWVSRMWSRFVWAKHGRQRGNQERSAFRGRILACMAGAEAEREIIGELFGGDDDDRYQIALMLEEIDEADREARLRRFARMLVRRHRALIEHVAQALSTERTL